MVGGMKSMATRDIVEYVVTELEGLHYHELVTPEGGGEPVEGDPIYYFEHVWGGTPKKIPDTNKRIAMVEIADIPAFEYTTCPTLGKKEVDINVTIGIKGNVERATMDLYDLTDVVVAALNSMDKMDGIVYWSEVQSVSYVLLQAIQGKNLFVAAEVRVKVVTGVT